MLLGFYRVLSATEGDYRSVVKGHTNVVYTGPVDAGEGGTDPSTRLATLTSNLKKIAKKGFKIVLDLERHNDWGLPRWGVLKAARPVWGSIAAVCIADEDPRIDYAEEVEATRRKIWTMGLQDRPIGATFQADQIEAFDAALWGPLEWVGIEAYTDPGVTVAQGTAARLRANIAKVGEGYEIIVVAQAYNRGGTFTDPAEIAKVNNAAFSVAQDTGAFACIGFAYGRVGGVRDLPALQAQWKGFWKEMNA